MVIDRRNGEKPQREAIEGKNEGRRRWKELEEMETDGREWTERKEGKRRGD